MAEEIKYAVGPDGRIVNYDPHNQSLKAGWREATEADIGALLLKQARDENDDSEPEITHESVVELTSE